MSATLSYELQYSRHGRWLLDSLHDDKEIAVHEARRLAQSVGGEPVRVIEERFDADTGETRSSIVFATRPRGEPQHDPRKTRDHLADSGARKDEEGETEPRKSGAIQTLVLLVLGAGGLTLAALLGLFAVLELAG
jgi:hypothetical protein